MRLVAIGTLAALLIGALGGTAALAADGVDNAAAERQAIAAQRASAQARYSERERECLQRFVVTSCIDDAKRERREALAETRREQNELDDRLRKARAAERIEAIRNAREAQRRHDATVRPQRAPEPRTGAERPSKAGAAAEARHRRPPEPMPQGGRLGIGSAHQAAPSAAARQQQEARSRATFDAAQRAAEAHRREIEERNAHRAATRKPAAPLPQPPGLTAQ